MTIVEELIGWDWIVIAMLMRKINDLIFNLGCGNKWVWCHCPYQPLII